MQVTQEGIGSTIPCPHCGAQTELTLEEPAGLVADKPDRAWKLTNALLCGNDAQARATISPRIKNPLKDVVIGHQGDDVKAAIHGELDENQAVFVVQKQQ